MYFENQEIKKCTRCGAEFKDLRMQVTLDLYTERLRDTGVWEEIPNLCQESVEYLCPECFNKWVDIQSQMNIPYQDNPKYADVDPHLNDKYKDHMHESLTPNFDKKLEEMCSCKKPEVKEERHETSCECEKHKEQEKPIVEFVEDLHSNDKDYEYEGYSKEKESRLKGAKPTKEGEPAVITGRYVDLTSLDF